MDIVSLEVPPQNLVKTCDPNDLGFESTEQVSPLEGTIGQERAISALEFGLGIDAPDFNVFVSGIAGTGRNTTLKAYLEKAATKRDIPSDWGYVHNFHDTSRPMAISLPCGMVHELAKDMNELLEGCKRDIPAAFDSDSYQHRIEEVVKDGQEEKKALYSELEEEAAKAGYTINFTPSGIITIPLQGGRPMAREEYAALPEETRNELKEKGENLQHIINHRLADIKRLDREMSQHVREVDKEIGLFTIQPIIQDLKEKYAGQSSVIQYLDDVQTDVIEHLDAFKPKEEEASPQGILQLPKDDDLFVKYQVNILVDNQGCQGAPVVFEYSPTYYNLFGRIEYRARLGTMVTDLTMIKAGAIHKANGGYLVIQAVDLLTNPLSWNTLKRTLRSQEARIENIGEQYSPIPTATLSPEPIPVKAKIVMVGSPQLFQILQAQDEDFRKYFKAKADFDISMERTHENMMKYASFIVNRCHEGNLRPFHNSAVARIIDYSSRLVEHQDKLTTRFIDVADIITEANYWAQQDNHSPLVKDKHVQKAIEQRIYRSNLPEDKLQEFIQDGTLHISTEGEVVGQVNGLAILSLGDYIFGKPSRITARVSLGRGQVMNIERETQMSGPIHSKGFLILTGYLTGKYGHDKPLSLSASIGFEQTYDEVDGDSASSTELYALLSSLSGLPLKQNIAVTGSVNQQGAVQAVGGVTHKIEGFFRVCQAKGLTGDQGVILPKDNLKNLVLKDEVVQAVAQGKFHIYGVSTIDQGIEVLTGVPAGNLKEDGTYDDQTVHSLVEERLKALAQKARQFGRNEAKDERD